MTLEEPKHLDKQVPRQCEIPAFGQSTGTNHLYIPTKDGVSVAPLFWRNNSVVSLADVFTLRVFIMYTPWDY